MLCYNENRYIFENLVYHPNKNRNISDYNLKGNELLWNNKYILKIVLSPKFPPQITIYLLFYQRSLLFLFVFFFLNNIAMVISFTEN